MANTEIENTFNSILESVKKGTAEVETIKSVTGKDAKGKDAVVDGEWKIGDYVFKYSVPEGKKYGKATVEQSGSDVAVDTFGIDKVVMCIVYFLRNPKTHRSAEAKAKRESKKTEKPVKEKKAKAEKKAPAKKAKKTAEPKAEAPVVEETPALDEGEVEA